MYRLPVSKSLTDVLLFTRTLFKVPPSKNSGLHCLGTDKSEVSWLSVDEKTFRPAYERTARLPELRDISSVFGEYECLEDSKGNTRADRG